MPQYVSYLRVSTQRQGQSGLGIEAQRAAVAGYLAQQGGSLIEEFVEIESGGSRTRPILMQSIARARKLGATLLIAKLDRLARNVAFVSSLMESGIEFLAVDAPYANRLMIHILAAFAEHERLLISERTKAALAAAKARGVRLGANGAKLGRLNHEQALASAETLRGPVEEALRAGNRTLMQVSDVLNDAGHRTPKNSLWSVGTTHRLLRRLHVEPQHDLSPLLFAEHSTHTDVVSGRLVDGAPEPRWRGQLDVFRPSPRGQG